MTIKQTLAAIREFTTVSARWDSDVKEYRIAIKRVLCLSATDHENSAYYTSDSQDAIGTARKMHQNHGK